MRERVRERKEEKEGVRERREGRERGSEGTGQRGEGEVERVKRSLRGQGRDGKSCREQLR